MEWWLPAIVEFQQKGFDSFHLDTELSCLVQSIYKKELIMGTVVRLHEEINWTKLII